MSENVMTWESLPVVLQETLQAIVDGKWVFTPNAVKLQDMGLVQRDFSDTSFVVFAPTPAGLAIMPTDTPAPTDDLARLQADNARLREALERIEAFNPHTIKADLTEYQKEAQALLYVQAIAGLALGDTARKALEGGE